jgi:hypothetical protein
MKRRESMAPTLLIIKHTTVGVLLSKPVVSIISGLLSLQEKNLKSHIIIQMRMNGKNDQHL